MKKLLALLMTVLIITTLTGCGIKEKVSQKINEKISEKVIEKVTDSKVNIDGDKVTVKTEDGSEVTYGETEWPDTPILKGVPKFEKGKISGATSSDEMAMIFIEEVEKEDYESYVEKIKAGYSLEPASMDFDNAKTYVGKNEEGITVTVTYNIEEKSLSMSVGKQ